MFTPPDRRRASGVGELQTFPRALPKRRLQAIRCIGLQADFAYAELGTLVCGAMVFRLEEREKQSAIQRDQVSLHDQRFTVVKAKKGID